MVPLLPQLPEEPLPLPVELTLSQPLRRSQRVSYAPLHYAHCARTAEYLFIMALISDTCTEKEESDEDMGFGLFD